jgi:hypothetical protein
MNASKSNNIEFLGSAFGNSRAANNEPCQEPTMKAVLHPMHDATPPLHPLILNPSGGFGTPAIDSSRSGS